MKYLIINGSAHNGNTYKLQELAKQELAELDARAEFQEIRLRDCSLPFCLGCSLCFRKGHSYCPHNTIIQPIIDGIEQSDGVIFSFPTYNMQLPALMKNLVDHFCFIQHRPRYFTKLALILTTTGAVGAKNAAEYLAGAARSWGFNRCYLLPVAAVSWNDYKPTNQHRKQTNKIAKQFYEALAGKKLRSPTLGTLIPFNLFRGMSYAYKPGTEYAYQDGVFWEETGLIHRAYAPQIPLPIHKQLFGNLFFLLGKKMSKSMIVTYKK
ncbi:flavodoxin family protein [Acetanaerobacterium elongatum]|uniref:NADPH-dependent FMN reductase n=1 Tax=Acetanaerobacterium elongatum TaxID=258515 RepID=A0A1H0DYE6_9FIRM|nr:NAD(P)H-dependent oxidoreductase [Acetanaerobacterium elongatum]SDN75214.1 NADPH-dependent FMN reductase [Acetanaerobacterium elongatum]